MWSRGRAGPPLHVSSLGIHCLAPASTGTRSLVIVHCGEIKEFQNEALECLAASQLSYEDINSIVVSPSFPCSQNCAYCTPAPLSLQGDGSATPGNTEILEHKLRVLPALIFYKNGPVLTGSVDFVTFSMHRTAAWSPFQ